MIFLYLNNARVRLVQQEPTRWPGWRLSELRTPRLGQAVHNSLRCLPTLLNFLEVEDVKIDHYLRLLLLTLSGYFQKNDAQQLPLEEYGYVLLKFSNCMPSA